MMFPPAPGTQPLIATLTMNPTIDVAYEADTIVPMHKIRTAHEYCNPGGGGINVARVFVRLGGQARCLYLSGGPTGVALDAMIDLHQLVRTRVPIAGMTRVATTALERSTGREFRFTPEGPTVREAEWRAVLAWLEEITCSHLVASGSLPPGVPADFYAEVGRTMTARGVKFVLDTSGEALRQGLASGTVTLVKPSRGELEALVGQRLSTRAEVIAAARDLVARRQAKMVAVTLGHEGAVLAHRGGVVDCPALPVIAQSAVGAGDSFVAGMVHALCSGKDAEAAFRIGVAAGTAAVLHPGTDLAHPADINRLLAQLEPA